MLFNFRTPPSAVLGQAMVPPSKDCGLIPILVALQWQTRSFIMISLRENLPKIGIPPGTPVSYRAFASRPSSLSQAIRSMDAPQNWQQVSDLHYDENWTDEVDGVGWDGANWIFSCNARQSKPGANHKAIYVFKGGQPLKDDNWIC